MPARTRCMLTAALALAAAAAPALGDAIYDFTYISTTDNAYNDRAYLMNTGIQVEAGDWVEILGTGQINFGSGRMIRTNFDMALLSPLDTPVLIRDFYGDGADYLGVLTPLPGETPLFGQDRSSLGDVHDRVTMVQAPGSGFLYIGLFDAYFADNSGQHDFEIRLTPEPQTLGAVLLVLLLVRRPVRGR